MDTAGGRFRLAFPGEKVIDLANRPRKWKRTKDEQREILRESAGCVLVEFVHAADSANLDQGEGELRHCAARARMPVVGRPRATCGRADCQAGGDSGATRRTRRSAFRAADPQVSDCR